VRSGLIRRERPAVRRRVGALAAALAALALWTAPGRAEDALAKRQVLWRIVSEQCLPAKEAGKPPLPCLALVLPPSGNPGFAVLKDLVGAAQVLLIPTAQIDGIESPEAIEASAGAYWQAAWNARFFLFGLLGREISRDAISLAINSQRDRSQDQLHIHVDCLRTDVRSALRRRIGDLARTWTPDFLELEGRRYDAMRLDALAGANPFSIVAKRSAETAADMGAETLVVVGATFPDGAEGFVLLEDRAGRAPGDNGHGEDLQDHSCAVATD
jgi:CDP-diacylglycerol pyrophosphatase